MNTYGLFSINNRTLNIKCDQDIFANAYDSHRRMILVTILKINNLAFNILGYLPVISTFSGCLRIGMGIRMCTIELRGGNEETRTWKIWDHLEKELFRTGITQIARGVLEAFVPFGKLVNASLDVVATIYNINVMKRTVSLECHPDCKPYADPPFNFPLQILRFV